MNSLEQKWLDYYTPLWEEFWNTIGNNIPSNSAVPHLPHCGDFSAYDSSKYKIAFIGIDAYGWGNDLDKYNINSLPEYLHKCQDHMDGSNWQYPNPVFWNFILKFLGNLYNQDWREMKEAPCDSKIVQGIVWGNIQSIGKEETTNLDSWDKIKVASKIFDKMQHVLDVFSPDIVVMLNYSDNKTHYDYLIPNLKNSYLNALPDIDVEHYFLSQTKTNIYVTYHPRVMELQGLAQNDVIDKIVENIRLRQ